MKGSAGVVLGAVAVLTVVAGCAQHRERALQGRAPTSEGPSADLVVPSTGLMELGLSMDGSGAEASRNDGSLGVDGYPGAESLRLLEVRSVDRQWTINGRVREFSRTTTRTWRRGVIRSE